MKIVIIGGTGLIGRKLAPMLRNAGHEVVSASPSTGVNTLTGVGLADALHGAHVVVDVSNSPSFEDEPVLHFFRTSTGNLTRAASEAGVQHLAILSVVGAERLPDSGYMKAKLVQENLVRTSGLPYSILRATQFFEFVGAIAESGVQGDGLRLPSAAFQPVAADDVAAELAKVAAGSPLNATADLAGPDRAPLAEMAQLLLKAKGDTRAVAADPEALYFGQRLDDHALVPAGPSRVGALRFQDWLRSTPAAH